LYVVGVGFRPAVGGARAFAGAPRSVWETLRYGLRGTEADGATGASAEILATGVAADCAGRGIGTRLVRAAIDELERRGVTAAHVVTAVGNVAAIRAYEGGGLRRGGRAVVHRGVTQELLVWP
jgi:ribosomal protein S18 acetylase RimI-like enzyme